MLVYYENHSILGTIKNSWGHSTDAIKCATEEWLNEQVVCILVLEGQAGSTPGRLNPMPVEGQAG